LIALRCGGFITKVISNSDPFMLKTLNSMVLKILNSITPKTLNSTLS
jgi:hypothetical protein